ncbi:hypothetical protein ALI144C_44805 [Actinosynnema sp. ALI-1.44]|nr:hypothetical protein ALI144C_44805 [Actinosynnema sp. ALI-1.44]
MVEIAWGADIHGDDALWTWTDVTGDLRDEPAMSIEYGRADEASTTQPASCTMTLDNRAANYSLGGASPNWPNVKKNVPLRVRIDPNGVGFQTVFQGNVTGFTPAWDSITGRIPVVDVLANGSLRRLLQGFEVERSAPRRFYTQRVNIPPIVYYALDEGPLASSAKATVGTGEAFIDPVFLSTSGDATLKYFGQGKLAPWLPEGLSLNKFAILKAPVPATPKTTEWWFLDLLVSFAEGDPVDGLFSSVSSLEGGESGWGARMDAFHKEVTVIGYVPGAGPVDLATASTSVLFDGDVHHVRFWVHQTAPGGTPTVNIDMWVDDTFVTGGYIASQTIRHPDGIILFATENAARYFGHLGFWNNISWAPFGGDPAYYTLGAVGETAIDRIERLCLENAIPLTVIGDTGNTDDTSLMGPQSKDGLVPLLRQCETVEQGVLFDGLTNGLTYVCRATRENAVASLTIDVGGKELFPPFGPTHDDARVVNKATASRAYGGEYTHEDVTGPQGTAVIGTYDTSITVHGTELGRIEDYAGWLVNLGTVEGYRFPTVTVNLSATPHLAAQVLALRPGSRIDLINVDQVFTTLGTSTISLFVEGVQMSLNPHQWLVTFQCSPFDPWRVIVLAATTGDTDPNLCHLQTDGARTTTTVAVNATSFAVETTAGPVWTTAADDFPFHILVGGVKVRVTGITGAASPQTFTTDPMPIAVPIHSQVEVWQPPVLRL